MMRCTLLILLAVVVAAGAAGCGSDKKTTSSSVPPPAVLPPADTPYHWAGRVVELILRPLNSDLTVVNTFATRQVQFYLIQANKTTLRILRRRLGDLAKCSQKIVVIGPPPAGRKPLQPVYKQLKKSCANYEEMSARMQKAALFLSSGRSDVVAQGRKMTRELRPLSIKSADDFRQFLRLAQRLPEFRKAGLQPSTS